MPLLSPVRMTNPSPNPHNSHLASSFALFSSASAITSLPLLSPARLPSIILSAFPPPPFHMLPPPCVPACFPDPFRGGDRSGESCLARRRGGERSGWPAWLGVGVETGPGTLVWFGDEAGTGPVSPFWFGAGAGRGPGTGPSCSCGVGTGPASRAWLGEEETGLVNRFWFGAGETGPVSPFCPFEEATGLAKRLWLGKEATGPASHAWLGEEGKDWKIGPFSSEEGTGPGCHAVLSCLDGGETGPESLLRFGAEEATGPGVVSGSARGREVRAVMPSPPAALNRPPNTPLPLLPHLLSPLPVPVSDPQ
ncbi:unnamed protein product [Closterium sp. NIES-64]|nr:unnamed protein product [Closterium sp. NIES-64]